MKRRKQVQYDEIDLGEGLIEKKSDQEGCKYPVTLGREDVCQDKMKEILRKEDLKRRRAVLKSSLNGGKVIML